MQICEAGQAFDRDSDRAVVIVSELDGFVQVQMIDHIVARSTLCRQSAYERDDLSS